MVPSPSPDTVFPSLFLCTKVADSQPLFDVKFYPWPTEQDEQVFAVCGEKDVFVCRLQLGADPPFEILRWFKDPNPSHAYNTIVWTQDPITQSPQLAFAGASPKQVQFYDIESDTPLDHRALSGHGKGINDMAVSPISPNLIATASEDYTIRLWNMDPSFTKQPCVALFAGEGHRQPILACSFHPNGKWLLSSGLDTAVCLWAVPSPSELLSRGETSSFETPINPPKVIYYPHFHSTEIHANYIDNAVFYGDLILSRAALDQNARKAENIIMLWKIEGFDSDAPAPSEPPIPGPGISTRSAFPHAERSRGFQRLMTFDMPHTGRFYLRFGLLHQPDMRPVLAMGNDKSRFCFWDLQKLEEGYEAGEEEARRRTVATGAAGRKRSGRGRGTGGTVRKKGVAQPVSKVNLDRLSELRREQGGEFGVEGSSSGGGGGGGGGRSSTTTTTTGDTPEPSGTSVSVAPERKYQLGHSFEPLAPHHQITANTALSPSNHFATTQIDWSPDGCWMVAVGDHGMVCIFHRDKSVV
ncbi:WD40 repeat-like protein [Hortaea werneckii]|nr:WD40 repeat-like protein [Hortaea werneckii]KAI7104312.1 WD40 repeat-like protein [Hortaea werneckii]KAI7224801.1 WD40 repeat-like protein [Hortaea werneckii]KAI7321112.1 WD40 repeat-like protein [Hortaea werneckii]KAI7380302.1 WD40 repeat-like protein [Hortaea werneckii]